MTTTARACVRPVDASPDDALLEAHLAASCLRCLLDHMDTLPASERFYSTNELNALHDVIDAEIERRSALAGGPLAIRFRR